MDLLFHNIDALTTQAELLLCCKTVVRDKRVAAAMTPQLFVRLLEIAQLTNIHEVATHHNHLMFQIWLHLF